MHSERPRSAGNCPYCGAEPGRAHNDMCGLKNIPWEEDVSERSSITAEDKIAVIKREIALRMLVYPRRVQEGKMKPDKADFEIKVMQEILADYRGLNASRT